MRRLWRSGVGRNVLLSLLVLGLLGKIVYNNKERIAWERPTLPTFTIPEFHRPDREWSWEDDEQLPEDEESQTPPLPDSNEITIVPSPLPDSVSLDSTPWQVPVPDLGRSRGVAPNREAIIAQEKALVEEWFCNQDSFFLKTPYGNVLVRRTDFWLALQEYKAERISTRDRRSGKEVLMHEGWAEYMKFISSSVMFANKLVKQMGILGLSKEKKVDAILLCMQQKRTSMRYKYDLNPGTTDTTCYMRKPVISLVDGLKNGYVGDCEDFATDFLTLCLAAGIPEQDLYICLTENHAFPGVRNISKKGVDYSSVYITPDKGIVVPIEPTISADMDIESCVVPEGIQHDTIYTKTPTIGYPSYPKVVVRGKKYPQGVVPRLGKR